MHPARISDISSAMHFINTLCNSEVRKLQKLCTSRLAFNFMVYSHDCISEPYNLIGLYNFIRQVDTNIIQEIHSHCANILSGQTKLVNKIKSSKNSAFVPYSELQSKSSNLTIDKTSSHSTTINDHVCIGKMMNGDLIRSYIYKDKIAEYIDGNLMFEGKIMKSVLDFVIASDGADKCGYVVIKKVNYSIWRKVKISSIIL